MQRYAVDASVIALWRVALARTQASQHIYDSTPDGDGLGKSVGEGFACFGDVDEDNSAVGEKGGKEVEVWTAKRGAPVAVMAIG